MSAVFVGFVGLFQSSGAMGLLGVCVQHCFSSCSVSASDIQIVNITSNKTHVFIWHLSLSLVESCCCVYRTATGFYLETGPYMPVQPGLCFYHKGPK